MKGTPVSEQLNTIIESRKRQIAIQLSEIGKKIDDLYQGPMHWGHAGDLGRVLNALKEVHQFLDR